MVDVDTSTGNGRTTELIRTQYSRADAAALGPVILIVRAVRL
jgi:hypothetical protein